MAHFYYELHEGATDLMTDALLASERDHTPEQFAEMVRAARAAIIETFEEDTYLVEQSDEFRSIVAELERP